MTARRKERKRALDILFEAEQRAVDALELLAARQADPARSVGPYAARLVEGVVACREQIDALLAAALSGDWTLPRLPAVDRAVLRIAVYELRFGNEVPAAVALSEAVGLAAELSTDDSPAYVNGVLSTIAGLPANVG